ncbi:MAG: hypothetical protein UEA60_07250 [Lachnospiraceae bacterium]|nr:hypothetical protein [Lachnospiraceae bacterium]
MDRIVKLDNKLNKIDSYNRVVGKFFVNLLIVLMVFTFLAFPNEEMHDVSLYLWLSVMVSMISDFKLSPYLYTKINGVKVSIYKCLKETTISKKDFIKSRLKKHFIFISKFLGSCLLVRIMSMILFEKLTIMYVGFVIALICTYSLLATLSVIIDIYAATKD